MCCWITVEMPSVILTGFDVSLICAGFNPGRQAVSVVAPAAKMERGRTRL